MCVEIGDFFVISIDVAQTVGHPRLSYIAGHPAGVEWNGLIVGKRETPVGWRVVGTMRVDIVDP